MVARVIEELIGNTPMIDLDGINIKLETYNPTGSIKDRMACYLIKNAENRGLLKKGMEIIEITSGNTGISFAMISSIKGYKFTAVMPESMSIERRKIMELFGANIILTPKDEDMEGALRKYKEIIKGKRDVWLPNQFENYNNIKAYEFGLAEEILSQTNHKIDAFVAGIGTGGTIIGVARKLKERNPNVKIIGIEPKESNVLSGGSQGLHKIQGIGEGFVPKIVKDNLDLIDEIITIHSDDAVNESINIARKYGLMVGISSGANFLVSKMLKERFKDIVTVFPDRGERYLR